MFCGITLHLCVNELYASVMRCRSIIGLFNACIFVVYMRNFNHINYAETEMKLGPGSLGRPKQNLRMGPGSKFKLN